jgi:EamA domain-containing membrane protein RarD
MTPDFSGLNRLFLVGALSFATLVLIVAFQLLLWITPPDMHHSVQVAFGYFVGGAVVFVVGFLCGRSSR